VVERLRLIFAVGDPAQKLAAAIALAPIRDDCKVEALDRLLDGDPAQLKMLVPLCRDQIPEALASRLTLELQPAVPAGRSVGVVADRRRANAACMQIILGQESPAWSLLEPAPDAQARSFFIGSLGPAGVDPKRLLARLDDQSASDSARAASIVALESV